MKAHVICVHICGEKEPMGIVLIGSFDFLREDLLEKEKMGRIGIMHFSFSLCYEEVHHEDEPHLLGVPDTGEI